MDLNVWLRNWCRKQGFKFLDHWGMFCVLAVHPINANYEESIKTPNCAQYHTRACSRIRDPVCGTNEITFPNECMLCLHNWEYSQNVKIRKNGNC
ncbi:serine protease inhibitor Kazal-type 2-like [Stegostoma tigrinum]|uniref:serine protease inhibitor Kazal-type 2-like n=1 Tax=Stegostoma tigrinum TaxID=3053191 RepID=UPI00286FDE30|nr:serine protease inhibitor Kazal-type 2-like [Stegostoma tigrinum]